MEDKRIKAHCDWLDPQSIRDIEVFLRFPNFYQRFIQDFNQIATSLISMLRTIGVYLLSTNLILVGKNSTVDKIGNSKVDGAKIGTRITKCKSKILIKSFLTKSQSST